MQSTSYGMALNIRIDVENRYNLTLPDKDFRYHLFHREKVMKDVQDFVENAKKHGKTGVKFTLKSGETSSLHKMIKTKEQAHIFMTLLKSM